MSSDLAPVATGLPDALWWMREKCCSKLPGDRAEEGIVMLSHPLTRRAFGLATTGSVLSILAGRAAMAALPAPTEKPILTISGKIRNFNNGETAVFDRAMLEALGMVSFETATPWYDKVVRFEGPLMTSVMEAVDAFGDSVVATALNDYSTTIPRSDFAQFKTILALKRDGAYLPVRDKGPLFVVYPYDSNPELKQQKYYGRSAWQVAQFTVK
jgi:hypothetical protein